jgi:preprotein translocase subunit SecG
LLQQGKGADMGATFGGGSNTLFGAGGADTLLVKVTTALAAVFMLTTIYLAVNVRTGFESPESTLFRNRPEAPAEAAPAANTNGVSAPAATTETPPANSAGAATGPASDTAVPPAASTAVPAEAASGETSSAGTLKVEAAPRSNGGAEVNAPPAAPAAAPAASTDQTPQAGETPPAAPGTNP